MGMDSDGTEDAGWDVDPEDEQGVAVLSALGRQLRTWREQAGMRASDLGVAIGYGEDLVRKVESLPEHRRPRSVSSTRHQRCDAPSGAQWCGTDSSNGFWR